MRSRGLEGSIFAPIALVGLVALVGCGEAPEPSGRGVPGGAAVQLPSVDDFLAAAESLYAEARFDTAIILWERALPMLGGTDREPTVLTWLTLAARNQGDYGRARELGERAIGLHQDRGIEAGLARSYNALGLLAWDEGRLLDAAALYQQGLVASRRMDDLEYTGKLSNNLALLQLDLGRFEHARANFALALETSRRLHDRRSEARVVTNLAVADLWSGDPVAGLEKLEEATRLHREIRDPVGEIEALGQRGVALAAIGELRRAFLALDSARALARRHGLREEEASNLEMLADLYAEAGDDRRAMGAYRESAAAYEALGANVKMGDILRSQAALQRAAGDLDVAWESLQSALDRHRVAGAELETIDDLLALAELMAEAGGTSAAAPHLAAAQEQAAALRLRSALSRVTLSRARIAEAGGDPGGVLAALDDLAQGPERIRPASLWELEALRARAWGALDQQDSAVAAGRRAVSAVERVRQRIGTQVLRTSYTNRMASVYGHLVLSLLKQGAVDEAFEVADAARGRSLLEHLSTARDSAAALLPELSEADDLLRRIDELLDRLDELHGEVESDRAVGLPAGSDLLAELEAARSRYEALMLRFSQRRPTEATLVGARPPSAARVQRSLEEDEVLLEYLVLDDRFVVFVVTAQSLRPLEVSVGRAQIASRVRLARSLMQKPELDVAHLDPVLDGLHELLIQPALETGLLRGTRLLTVVPHGPLGYLPFAALRERETGRYLGDRFALRTLPSAGALSLVGGSPPEARDSNGRPGPISFAPFPDRLPATATEARAVRELDPPGQIRLGTAATEAAVRAALAGGRPVHIASHAIMNGRHPMFSRVELSPGPRPIPGDDGRLEVHELLGIRSRSPLVFLSGCETGLGSAWSTDFDQREDYATLAQAFLYSGVETVVATLWRIDDDGAAFFAGRFYHHLRGLTAPEALVQAQKDLRRSRLYGHPYYWAAYFVSGRSGRPDSSPPLRLRPT